MRKLSGVVLGMLVAVFSLTSCDPASQFSEEISTIDSCLTKIDSLETLFDAIEFDSLVIMREHVERNEAVIKELYNPDTIDTELGWRMTDSKAVRKRLSDAKKQQLMYGDELNALKNQFQDLKDDILAGLLAEEEINNYLKTEKADLQTVETAFLAFHKMQEEEKERYYVTIPYIDAFVEQLKEESAQEENQ